MNDAEHELICEVLDVLIGCPANQVWFSQLSGSGRDVLERYAEFRVLGPAFEGTPEQGSART